MKFVNSVSISFVLLFMVVAMTLPIMASDSSSYIKFTVVPESNNGTLDLKSGSTYTYSQYNGTLDIKSGNTYTYSHINTTIPAKYKLAHPDDDKIIGIFNMTNLFGVVKTTIKIISTGNDNNTAPNYFVDINYSTNYGVNWKTVTNKDERNIVIGSTYLKLIRPTDSTDGYLNVTLGSLCCAEYGNNITVKMMMYDPVSNGAVKNPKLPGPYKWNVDARHGIGNTDYHSDYSVVTITP